jgi:K+ transporter
MSADDDEDEDEDIVDNYNSINAIRNRFNLLTNVELTSISSKIELNSPEDESRISVTPGVGCFLTHNSRQTPHVFESYIKLVRSIPQMIIFLRIQYARIPFIDPKKRLLIKLYGDIYHISATFGYAEAKNKSVYNDILLLAKELYQLPIPSIDKKITFFLPNQIIIISKTGWKSWISRWPLYLYSFQKKLVPTESINLKINPKNTIQIGIIAEL